MMEAFLSNLILWLLIGGSVIILFLMFFRNPGEDEENPGKLARFFKRKKEFLKAGLLYERAGNFKEAASMYEAAGAFGLMLSLCEKYGLREEEGRARARLGDHAGAGEIYEELKNFSAAFEEFRKGGFIRKAMECARKAGIDFLPLDEIEGAGGYSKVLSLLVERGERKRALEVGGKLFREKAAFLPSELRKSSPFLKRLAENLGRVCEEEGLLYEAARFYLTAGLLSKSAVLYETCGEKETAAELFLSDRDFHNARRIYEELGNTEKMKRVEAEIAISEKRFHEAALLYEELREYTKASELFEITENYTKAGEMLLKAGEFLKAAELFKKARNFSMAAEALEKAGEFSQAAQIYHQLGNRKKEAECYVKAGDFFNAGATFFELGETDSAIKFLQMVTADSPSWEKASRLLGILFAERGLYTQAIERLKPALKGIPCDNSTIRAFYALGVAMQATGNVKGALTVFEKVLSVDLNYKDVPQRVAELKQMLTPSSRRELFRLEETRDVPRRKGGLEEKYEIIEEIGRGGMGIVYKARDRILDRIVALKVLPPEFSSNREAVERFMLEAKACASLIHPNIVTIYEAGVMGKSIYISMEFINGSSVKELLDKGERLPYRYVVFIAGQVCKGLDFAHSKRIIHRDIKPGNIMLNEKKVAKIVDFGLARVMEEARMGYTVVSGTPYYMSPEQTLGEELDHRTDIYSLGITMYEMLAGEPPFTGGDVGYHHVHTPPPPLRSLAPDVPERLEKIVMKCLEKDPARRFQSAKELFLSLREIAK